jgi:hypothetical protein
LYSRRGAGSSHGGHSHRGHSHAGHSHSGRGFGYTPYRGFPYGGSYSSYYSPFGGSSFYGSVYPYGGCYNSTWGYPSGIYSVPTYQYIPTPVVVPYYPPFTQPLIDAQREEEERWAEALKFGSDIEIPIKPVVKSSTQEKLRAQRLQISGDELFRKQSFSKALRQYRQANSVAQDLPGPYFRMAIVYAIQGKFDAAVTYMKRTLELDPSWPSKGDTLTMLYGDNNSLARNALLIEVSRWVEDDIRDPDRSFLMGVLLWEFDREQAATFLETSARLSGTTRYVAPFLSPIAADDERNRPVRNAAPPDALQPDHGIPTPPVPQRDPTLKQNPSEEGTKIEPFPGATINLNSPRGVEAIIRSNQAPPQGPELPLPEK